MLVYFDCLVSFGEKMAFPRIMLWRKRSIQLIAKLVYIKWALFWNLQAKSLSKLKILLASRSGCLAQSRRRSALVRLRACHPLA